LVRRIRVLSEVTEEKDPSNDMLYGLVDLLIENGVVTEEEYEKRTKEKVRFK